MSIYSSNDPAQPGTPIYDRAVSTAPAAVSVTPPGGHDAEGGQAKHAADQAAGTVKDTAGQVSDQAKDLGAGAKQAGVSVAATTKEQASRVATDAISQARDLYAQATEELAKQAATQQERIGTGLRTFGGDLRKMGETQDGGVAAEFVHAISSRASRAGDWLDGRDPANVLDEVKQLAARRPVLFIALAAGTGILAARLTKALVADAKSDTAPAPSTPTESTTRTTTTPPVGTSTGTAGTSGGLDTAFGQAGLGDRR